MHRVLFGENDVSAAGSRLYIIIIDIHNTPYRNDLDGRRKRRADRGSPRVRRWRHLPGAASYAPLRRGAEQ